MSDKIIDNVDALKELNSRAQGEVSIRDALTELEVSVAGYRGCGWIQGVVIIRGTT